MNYIQDISSFITEAISMKMYKENLPKELWYNKSEGYKSWDSVFGKGVNRISIPLKNTNFKIPTSTPMMDKINFVFSGYGYKINSFEDYLNNKVYKIGDTKNPLKIGKLLTKINLDLLKTFNAHSPDYNLVNIIANNVNLFKEFDVSTERKYWKDRMANIDEFKIIISRHPYDLLGMSSGRDWRNSSCMRLGSKDDKVYLDILASMEGNLGNDKIIYYDEISGQHPLSIQKDITEGTLVAYVVNVDDNNIKHPISRLLIKPYINEKNPKDILWVSADKIYGKNVGGFKQSVDEWLDTWQGDEFHGLYCIKKGLYDDGKRTVDIKKPISKWTNRDKKKFLNEVCEGNWVLNSNGEVDVDGNVDMTNMKLTEIPIKFGKVSGYFDCSRNQLTSLEFAPTSVDGYFDCYNNQLTSLEFAPTSVDGFYCYNNHLTSLEFAPTSVGRDFDCSDQKNRHRFTEEEVRSFSRVGGVCFV